MGHKNDGIIGLIAAISLIWIIPNALKTLEANLHIADRIFEFAKTFSYPYDVYAFSLGLVVFGYAFTKFRKDVGD